MAAGAAATIRAHKARCRVAHPKPRSYSSVSGNATALRGGVGPVRQDKASPQLKGV